MRALILMLLSLAILFGCASPQDRAQKQQAEMSLAMEQYGPACTQVGYVRDTDPWRACIMQQASNSEAKKSWFSRWSNWWHGDKPKVTETSTTTGAAAGR